MTLTCLCNSVGRAVVDEGVAGSRSTLGSFEGSRGLLRADKQVFCKVNVCVCFLKKEETGGNLD